MKLWNTWGLTMGRRVNLPLTPCVGRCSTSYGGDFCRGCGRSVEQIRDWNTYTDDQKLEIMDQLKGKNHES